MRVCRATLFEEGHLFKMHGCPEECGKLYKRKIEWWAFDRTNFWGRQQIESLDREFVISKCEKNYNIFLTLVFRNLVFSKSLLIFQILNSLQHYTYTQKFYTFFYNYNKLSLLKVQVFDGHLISETIFGR